MKFITFTLLFLVPLCAGNTTNDSDKCYDITQGGSGQNCCNQKPLANPCDAVRCGSNTECMLRYTPPDHVSCTDDALPLRPSCEPPCRMYKCASYCVPTRDAARCPGCYCDEANPFQNPCLEENACGANEECVLQEVTCVKAPCLPVKTCLPKCQPVQECPENCLRYKDHNGCDKCHCCNACVNKKCESGKKCVLNQVACFTCPCPPIAECV